MPAARLRVPQEHRGVFAVPPLADAGRLLQENQTRFERSVTRVLGRPLPELRALARREAHTLAEDYLQYVAISLSRPSARASAWLVTGHQPELFHPGVWVKNFAAFGLARRHDLTPLHVIMDNDAVKSTSIRVPDVSVQPLRQVAAPFDGWSGPMPYEDYAIQDEAIFARFPDAVRELLKGAGYEPLLPKLWGYAQRLAPVTPLLGCRLAGARRSLEADWGYHNLEVPLSSLCRTEAFAWFASHLLAELPRFHQVHNECLRAYRRERRIRSRNHPVPELAADGDWLEAPLWGWRAGEWQRQRLFVRAEPATLTLRLGNAQLAELPQHEAGALVAGFRQIEANGVKLRPRALSTTLFLRLFLADLFVHGIGGAIYDELTDRIIHAFYGMEAPGFLTLSATLHLPLKAPREAVRLLCDVRRHLRDLEWKPERYTDTTKPGISALVREKQRLIELTPSDAADRLARFNGIRNVTEQLRPSAAGLREVFAKSERLFTSAAESERVANDREYAFCLYPESELREFMARFTA